MQARDIQRDAAASQTSHPRTSLLYKATSLFSSLTGVGLDTALPINEARAGSHAEGHAPAQLREQESVRGRATAEDRAARGTDDDSAEPRLGSVGEGARSSNRVMYSCAV